MYWAIWSPPIVTRFIANTICMNEIMHGNENASQRNVTAIVKLCNYDSNWKAVERQNNC